MSKKLVVAVDFDGTLNNHIGYDGNKEYKPLPYVRYFLEKLEKEYVVIIFSHHNVKKIWKWLKKHDLKQYVDDVTNLKPDAVAYIDDRAINFNGDYDEVLSKLEEFKAHWE